MKTNYANFRDGQIYLKDQIGKVSYTTTFTGWLTDITTSKSTYGTNQWTFKFIDSKKDEWKFVGDNFNRSIITLINILSQIKNFKKPITITTELKKTRKGKDYTHIHLIYEDKELAWNKHVPSIPVVEKDEKGNAKDDSNFQQLFLYLYVDIKENLTLSKVGNSTRHKIF